MDPFRELRSVAIPFDFMNVDTDQLFPARFQSKPRGNGFANELFHDLRFDDGGLRRPDFILNKPEYKEARILVAGRNFGCGSSREQAVWALHDSGFRAVIAPNFSDIFFNNCSKNGLLAITLPEARINELFDQLKDAPGEMYIDVEAQTVIGPDGKTDHFSVSEFTKQCLLHGFDEMQYTLTKMDQIEAFEKANRRIPPVF